jgi:hypothetical protein
MRVSILLAGAMFLWAPLAEAKTKYTKITVEVKNDEGEPVDRAAVIVKPVKGKKVKASYELRTSQQGTAPLPPLEAGAFLIQVIAKGYQTHGERYEIREPERTIEIKLSPPKEQFSVHGPGDPRAKAKPQ